MNDDIERRLRDALRVGAEQVPIAGDGLQNIRSRTAGRRRHAKWQPALAVGALTVLVVAGVAAGVERNHGDRGTDLVLPASPVTASPTATPTASSAARPTVSPEPTACPSMDPSLLPGCHVTSTGVPKDTGGEYISITSPASGGVVHHTFTVSGKARVFEAQFTVDVSQNGVVIKTAHVTASAGAPELGTWSTTFTLPDGNYRIDAYELSPKGDGSKVASDTVWIQAGSPPGPPQATPASTASATER